MSAYAKRVEELEAEGMTRSDAQGVADAEVLMGKLEAERLPMRKFLVVGEGRSKRFYLLDLKDAPSFKAGAPGRKAAKRHDSRAAAETVAMQANKHDRHGITWRAVIE